MNTPLVECRDCGWIHFAVSREHAENEVREFNEYYSTLAPDEQEQYYGSSRSSIKTYEHCNFCGKPADMVTPTKELNGGTIGPIIWESYEPA